MSILKIFRSFAWAGMALPVLLVSETSWSQSEQVLSEVGAFGHVANGDQGVVKPDFSDELAADYAAWVEVAPGRSFKSFALSVFGTVLVLDGTTIREFAVSGQEKTDRGFPVDCTDLPFGITQSNGRTATVVLTSCSALTPLNDGTIRIAGEVRGTGVVVVAYDPHNGAAVWKATASTGAIVDMDGDEYEDSGNRLGAGYWAVTDREEVLFFPLAANTREQDVRTVTTVSGRANLQAVTPFGADAIVALDSGELLAVNAKSGANRLFAALPTGEACGLAKNAPQKYSLRGDPSGVLFAGNMGCGDITAFNTSGQPITASDTFAENPFGLDDPATFHVEGLDWQIGEAGDFVECDVTEMEEGCEFGQKEDQGVLWDVEVIGNGDTTFRMFQFVDLVDCRWSGDRPCPILNCPEADDDIAGNEASCPAPKEQVLDLAQLLIRAEPTFAAIAFPDGNVPVMAIPPYARGEEVYPTPGGGFANNGYKFHSFFAVTEAFFTGTFFTDYKVDAFRQNSLDPCFIPVQESEVEAVNETANLILYNGDKFGTVDRGGDVGTRGGVIVNDACNGRGIGATWSAQTVGLELYDEQDDAYVHHAARMMQELVQARDELLCSPFPDPDGGPDLGPLLPASDCSTLEGEVGQMQQKLQTCLESFYAPLTGGSDENCNAFDTKVLHVQNLLDAAAWPPPPAPNQPVPGVLRPNYEGQFRGRLATLLFFLDSYVFNSVPAGGYTSPSPFTP